MHNFSTAIKYLEDEKVLKFYNELCLTECKNGDITWEDVTARDKMNQAIGKGDKGVYKKLASQGRIGCASLLN